MPLFNKTNVNNKPPSSTDFLLFYAWISDMDFPPKKFRKTGKVTRLEKLEFERGEDVLEKVKKFCYLGDMII